MVTVQVPDVKSFMKTLLLSTTFDDWGFEGAEVTALTKYSIAATLNSRYLTDEEKASHPNDMLQYAEVRQILSSIIKAGRTPTQIKMVLSCPQRLWSDHTSNGAESYLLTLYFQNGILKLNGGISMRTFTMDRSDALYWDTRFPQVLDELGIACISQS